MGQRHQLFFIARLLHKDSAQPRYRCVVAVHHQWLFGRTALHACKAILELLRNKENAEIAREELATIAATYSINDRLPQFAAPFLSWLFIGAVRFRLEEQYVSRSSDLLDANMGSHEGDNNDGITVFDITNPLKPAYCFVSICGLESARRTLKRDVPLTAEQYVREYYPPPTPRSVQNDDDDDDEPYSHATSQEDGNGKLSQAEVDALVESEVLELIRSFVDERLVERWMLDDAWPDEGYEPPTARGSPKTPHSALLDDPEHFSAVPTLSELSLRKTIDQAQEYGDIAGLEVALSLPGTGPPRILRMLTKLDHYSDATLEIMVKALRDAGHAPESLDSLDLSPYALTPDQIVEVAARFPDTKTLRLGGNTHLDGQTLSRLLQVLPALSRLNVYNCNDFSPSDIDAVLSSATHLEVIYHRKSMIHDLRLLQKTEPFADELFAAPPKVTRNKTPPAFTFYVKTLEYFRDDGLCGYSLKSYSPRQIVVCLDDLLGSLQGSQNHDQLFSMKLPVILSGLPRPPHVPFKDRTLGPIPGKETLATEGWLYMLALKELSDIKQFYLGAPSTVFVLGFVKYRFANLKEHGEGGSEAKDCVRPPLESVEVMGLAEWLQKADPDQTVEGEWIKRLEEKLSDFELISKELVIKLIEDIPLFTE